MTDHALARARALVLEQGDVPVFPVLPEERPADGLCVHAEDPEGAHAALMRFRDQIAAMWRIVLPGDAGTEFVIAAFAASTKVAPGDTPGALRLARSGADEWSSFDMEGVVAPERAFAGMPARGLIRLWWNGECHSVALNDQNALSLATLWQAPDIVVHRSVVRGAGHQETHPSRAPNTETPVLRPERAPGMGKLPDFMRQTEKEIGHRAQRNTLAAIVMDLFRFWPLRGGVGAVEGGKGGAADGRSTATGAAVREPGALSRLLGWLRWHTPLGAPLKNELRRRLDIVEGLIRAGAIDEALRLALKLGGDADRRRGKTLYPNRLPDARSSLDFTIDHSRFTLPILADASFHALRQRYAELAKELAGRGDFRRSAYISSKLLGDHALAVRTLEQGGLLAEAAKLAHDSGQHPSVVIRLLFKLGDLEAALAIAKRTGCFEALAAGSRGHDAKFHAFVLKAWTDQLIAIGQFVRALAITDELVEGAIGATGLSSLLDARRAWLIRALSTRAGDGFDGELVARALLTARWTADDIPKEALKGFPNAPLNVGREPFAGCMTDLASLMEAPDVEAKPALLGLLRALTTCADERSEEQASFWREGPGAAVLEPMARAMLEKASDGLRREDIDDLRTLLLKASLPVLAEDLRKLRSIHRAPLNTTGAWIDAAPDGSCSGRVAHACIFIDGQVLLSRESGELELLGRRGRRLWSGWADDVVGLVAVGGSRSALIVQRDRTAGVVLSRFSCVDEAIFKIGAVALSAWHDMTSETQWLVQIDGEVGALDLGALVASDPAMAFVWSMQITPRLLVRGFHHDPLSPSWITRDVSPERRGVQEAWTLWQGRELRTQLLTGQDVRSYYRGAPAGDPLPFASWRLQVRNGVCALTSLAPAMKGAAMHLIEWSDQVEKSLRRSLAQRDHAYPEGWDAFQSSDFGRLHVFDPANTDSGAEIMIRSMDGGRSLALKCQPDLGLSLVARAPVRLADGETAQLALFADRFGRLHRLDLASGVVLRCA